MVKNRLFDISVPHQSSETIPQQTQAKQATLWDHLTAVCHFEWQDS